MDTILETKMKMTKVRKTLQIIVVANTALRMINHLRAWQVKAKKTKVSLSLNFQHNKTNIARGGWVRG